MTNSSEHTPSIVTFNIRHLTENQFAELGVSHVAYVKPVMTEGKIVFAIHAANGAPMALAEDRNVALAAIAQHEMMPALVH